MPKLTTAATAGVRKPSGKERAGSRAPGTAQRYEDFAPAIGTRAGSSWHTEHAEAGQRSLRLLTSGAGDLTQPHAGCQKPARDAMPPGKRRRSLPESGGGGCQRLGCKCAQSCS